MSNTVNVTIIAEDSATVRYLMRDLLNDPLHDKLAFEERENALEARAELAEARNKSLQSVLDEKNTKIAALVREAGITSADVINNAYKDGEKDGKAEALQEQAYTNKLTAMTAHDDVLITLQRGVVPFHFRPAYLITFGRLPTLCRETCTVLPQYQRELIGTTPDTVGVYGFNKLTERYMFITQLDSWTLCPKHMTGGLAPLA